MERSVTPIPLHRMRKAQDLQPVERNEQPLDPGPPVERARPVSGLDSARLAAWRELNTRWPYALILMVGVLLGGFAPERLAHMADIAVIWAVLGLAFVFGVGGISRSDAFWRGLGGPSASRAAGRHLAQVVLLGVPWLVSSLHLYWTQDDRLGFVLGVFSVLAYASCSAMRLLFDSVFARVAASAGLLALLVGTTALSAGIRVWTLADAFEVRMWALIAVGLAASLLLEGRLGPLGAGLRRSGRWPLVTGLCAALLGPAVVEAAWLKPVGQDLVVRSWSGERALLQPFDSDEVDEWLHSSGRLWLWENGELSRLPITDVVEARLGPEGEVVYTRRQDPLALEFGEVELFVLRPDGSTLACGVRGWGADCAAAHDFLEGWDGDEVVLSDGSTRHYDTFAITDLRPDGSTRTWDMPYLMEDPW